MKQTYHGLMIFFAILLSGCARGSADPRAPGLFNYNPAFYEKRALEKREQLSAVEQDNQMLKSNTAKLESDKTIVLKENEIAKEELKNLTESLSSLEKILKSKQTITAVQRKEQRRILAELIGMNNSSKRTDNVENQEEKRLEIEKLKKRRDELEREAANLMKL